MQLQLQIHALQIQIHICIIVVAASWPPTGCINCCCCFCFPNETGKCRLTLSSTRFLYRMREALQRVRLEIFNCLVLRLNATRIKNIYPQAPHIYVHTHTQPVYFPHTHSSQLWDSQTAVHPVGAEVSECLRFSHHSPTEPQPVTGYRYSIYIWSFIFMIELFKDFPCFFLLKKKTSAS